MPHEAIPLSDLGRRQAQKLCAVLDVKPAAVLVSAFVRTHQTAAPLFSRFGMQPHVHDKLNEFSVIDHARIEGLDGPQRKPFVKAYWDNPDPHQRLGEKADTFAEFAARVDAFRVAIEDIATDTIIFGHGIWFALLFWRLLGYSADSADTMRAFRRFQLGFPMPNCAAFKLFHVSEKHWSVQAMPSLISMLQC